MGTVAVKDVQVAYDVVGEGDPVVLVHGTSQDRNAWILQTPVLAERFRVVLPEYAGSGQTTDPGGPLEVEDLAAQVAAVADDLGLERYHLAGFSLGAVVAAAVAANQPERVRSLVLLCGWATTDAQMRFQFDTWVRLMRADKELFARYAVTDGFTNAFFEAMGPEGVEELVATLLPTFAPGTDRQTELDARVDISAKLASIQAPTLVIGGTQDRFVPVEHSRRLAQAIPGARLVELPYGHLIPAEGAQALNEALVGFFSLADGA